MKSKFLKFYHQVVNFEKKIKAYLSKYHLRIQALSVIWEMSNNELIKECMNKKAPKKKQALVPKLTNMPADIKLAVLNQYLNR